MLAADAAVYGEALVHLAEAGVAGRPERGRERSDVLNTLGASLYRAGRFGEAIRRLNESIQALDGGDVPKGFAFLAMAHHRLGHGDEAKRWLDKLVAYQPKDGRRFLLGRRGDPHPASRGRIADPGKHSCSAPDRSCYANQECER